MIVFFTEEESMKVTLEKLMSRFWPNKIFKIDWIGLSFQGKSDLEKNIAPKMNSWNDGTPHFVILRDQDGRGHLTPTHGMRKFIEELRSEETTGLF